MAWTLRYATSAARAIRQLDPAIRRRVLAAVEKLAAEPERGKALQLTLKGLRSWRTGDFRIVYRVVESRLEILVVALGHRRDVYDTLRKSLRQGVPIRSTRAGAPPPDPSGTRRGILLP